MGSLTSTIDHGSLTGLGDDDHSLYLLASDATNRTTFATNWTDLTDTGATTLHKHDHGGMDGLADDDHTQYVLRSILTTRGDLPVRGASDWTRLGVGGANTVLTANATDPAWSATPTVTTLTTTGLLTAGNGLTVSAGTVTLPANSLVVGTTQLVTTSAGVGIGTADPGETLHVKATGQSRMIIDSGGAGDYNGLLLQEGTADRYMVFYGHASNIFRLRSFDIDGGGTDGDIFTIADGTNDVKFIGGIGVDNNAAPTSGIVTTGDVGIGTDTPVISGTGKLHMAADTFRLATARTPASAGAAGNAGEWCWDASFIYVCTATNSWERVAIAAW